MPGPPKTILAYADGSCIGNPGPGGWGVVMLRPGDAEVEFSGGDPATTNNRMELTAAIEALRRAEPGSEVVLRSDSEYVVRGINENRKRKANLDLWNSLDGEIARRRVSFEWVRGHADDPLNARADDLARSQAERIARGESAASSGRRREPAPRSEEEIAGELQAILRDDERILKCAGCGRMFVSRRAVYCTLVECQLKARRTAKPA